MGDADILDDFFAADGGAAGDILDGILGTSTGRLASGSSVNIVPPPPPLDDEAPVADNMFDEEVPSASSSSDSDDDGLEDLMAEALMVLETGAEASSDDDDNSGPPQAVFGGALVSEAPGSPNMGSVNDDSPRPVVVDYDDSDGDDDGDGGDDAFPDTFEPAGAEVAKAGERRMPKLRTEADRLRTSSLRVQGGRSASVDLGPMTEVPSMDLDHDADNSNADDSNADDGEADRAPPVVPARGRKRGVRIGAVEVVGAPNGASSEDGGEGSSESSTAAAGARLATGMGTEESANNTTHDSDGSSSGDGYDGSFVAGVLERIAVEENNVELSAADRSTLKKLGKIEGMQHLFRENEELRAELSDARHRIAVQEEELATLREQVRIHGGAGGLIGVVEVGAGGAGAAGMDDNDDDDEVSFVTEKLLTALSRNKKLESDLKKAKHSSTAHMGELSELQTERDELAERVQELEVSLQEAQSTLASHVIKLQHVEEAATEVDLETSQRLHADLSRAQIDLDTLRAAKREDEEKIAALVHQVKRDKATIQALRAEADNASPNADVMEKLAKYKAEKGAAVEEILVLRQRLNQARASAAKTEKKMRTSKRFLKQADEDYEQLDGYCDLLTEKNKLLIRRLGTMYNRASGLTLAKQIYQNVAYDALAPRTPNVMGVLQVRTGKAVKSWKNRFIIIKDNLFIYYKSQSGDPQNSIRLDGATVDICDDQSKYPNAFRIISRTKNEERLFRAKSEDDLRQWIEAMQVASQFLALGVRKPVAKQTAPADGEKSVRPYKLHEDQDDGSSEQIAQL